MSRTVPARGALVAWACLTVAIVAEVVGTSFMAHAARDGGWTGYLIMAGALALSYFFLALPSSWILRRTGMKKGLSLSLLVMAGGAALFGIGWGLVGLCPGPAIAALAIQPAPALLFTAAMALGAAIHRFALIPRRSA